jgi:hypothetical protein
MSGSPAISSCPRCGALLATGTVDGLCARCLGALNFDASTTEDGTGALPASPPPTADELAPFFPQFEVHSCLGRGGMGAVYKARQESLDRWAALTLLAPERAADPAFAQRFASEARVLAALSHPHIVAIHDFGAAGGHFYLLMEYVDGESLRQLLKTKRLTPAEALALATAPWWLPQRPAGGALSPTERDAALRQFEENLTALIEARQQALRQTPDGGSSPAALAAEIGRLEARDRELRELVSRSGTTPGEKPAP